MVKTKFVLILGANSDVAKEAMLLYAGKGYQVTAASRSTNELEAFVLNHNITGKVSVLYFDAVSFETHHAFYASLPDKPHIVLYAAGFLQHHDEAMTGWEGTFQMMKVNYCGAVSILNIIASDVRNTNLEKVIGLSSLAGVRGRKSNFIYGSTKAAFTQYLAGLRQYLSARHIVVNVVIAGYISSKMTAGLNLTQSLMLTPGFIAKAVVQTGNRFITVPGIRWKFIYRVLTLLPEQLVARLP